MSGKVSSAQVGVKPVKLVIVGGVFVIEAASVVIQVASFKLRGKRVFKMSPLHHHFELSGWAEPKVITRFLILAILFALRGSILPQIAPQVISLTAVACLVVATEQGWAHAIPLSAGIGPFTLIGLALSIFLSFRNSACYDRWWEARRHWGELICLSRNLSRRD